MARVRRAPPRSAQLGLFGAAPSPTLSPPAEIGAERGHGSGAGGPPPATPPESAVAGSVTADAPRAADVPASVAHTAALAPPNAPGTPVALFGGMPSEAAPARGRAPRGAPVLPASLNPADAALAAALPPNLRMGTSSWGFGGWGGIVWDRAYPDDRLSREGLGAYAAHPLLRTVGVDRTHYRPMTVEELAALGARVPPDFRFLVKAHEDCTLARFPNHPRYGVRREQRNPLFLDAGYAADIVVAPFVQGLGARGGVLLFQFAPQPLGHFGGVQRFAERLHGFLSGLPRGPRYAVELRNTALLVPVVADALHAAGVIPALSAWSGLPPVEEQARRLRADEAPARVIRWMLQEGSNYEEARERFAPFDQLVEPDPVTRAAIARLARDHTRDTFVIVNNKAEGSAPLSVFALAREIVRGG